MINTMLYVESIFTNQNYNKGEDNYDENKSERIAIKRIDE